MFENVCREDVVKAAWKRVREKNGAAGIDGKTVKDIILTEEKFINEIRLDLKAGTYEPKPARRVWIPKRDGKKRLLGIPTVKDRVIQTAVKMVIEPVFEADFMNHSYGFRPRRNCRQAIQEILKYLNLGLIYVVETDIEDFFNRIPHKRLLNIVGARIADPNILVMISMWLKSGVKDGRKLKKTITGTPQGGVISPLLANIYLNELDKYWEESRNSEVPAQMIRYADDLVILTENNPEQILEALVAKLRELDLNIKASKTRVLNACEEDFEFLGFKISAQEARS